jgi:segregation and condensation protein B
MQIPESYIGSLEAVLFLHGESIDIEKIRELLSWTEEEAAAAIAALQAKYAPDYSGLQLLIDKKKIQLVTKPAHSKVLERFAQSQLADDLTSAAVETLAIIAYLGPVERAKIDFIRGVNSAITVRNLTVRGLIEKVPGTSGLNEQYQASFELLKHVGVSKASELPEFEKFDKFFEAPPAQEEIQS